MPKVHETLAPDTALALKALGEAVRRSRRRRRWTQEQLAKRIGASDRTIRQLERGMPSVTIGVLAAVLEIFGLHQQLTELLANDRVEVTRRTGKAKKLDADF